MATSADQKTKQVYEFGPFHVDPEKELLLREGETVPIAPKAFQVLLALMHRNNQVVTKDDLLKTIWPDTFVGEANLSRNIFLLRKALGEGPQDHQYILTVPGHGYRFAEDVQLVPQRELDIVAAAFLPLLRKAIRENPLNASSVSSEISRFAPAQTDRSVCALRFRRCPVIGIGDKLIEPRVIMQRVEIGILFHLPHHPGRQPVIDGFTQHGQRFCALPPVRDHAGEIVGGKSRIGVVRPEYAALYIQRLT